MVRTTVKGDKLIELDKSIDLLTHEFGEYQTRLGTWVKEQREQLETQVSQAGEHAAEESRLWRKRTEQQKTERSELEKAKKALDKATALAEAHNIEHRQREQTLTKLDKQLAQREAALAEQARGLQTESVVTKKDLERNDGH